MEDFTEAGLRNELRTKWLGQGDRLKFYKIIDSTNEEAKRLFEKEGRGGILFAADSQSAGKGRRGRVWQSSLSTTIAMSYLLTPEFSADRASMLTLVMALAAAKGIKKACGLETKIKWPNDIVINGKKISGILTELSAEKNEIRYCIIGTGINVSVTDFPSEIKETATSLYLESGKRFSRSEITARIAEAFEEYYEGFLKNKDLSDFKDEYNSICVNVGRRVRVLDPKGEYEALAKGINDEGELLVERDDGSEEAVYAGEVSVRGIYGYT